MREEEGTGHEGGERERGVGMRTQAVKHIIRVVEESCYTERNG